MALLDLQSMASTSRNSRDCYGSHLSLALCDSTVSYALCL